ncbi:MAG: hypothetical protein ABR956_13280 [Terracidiphilus sp.]|jgi:hypothetical protein
MYSFRRLALLLALALPALQFVRAQSSSSSSNPAPPAQDQAQQPTEGQLSVQARIKARRAQRRAAAIHDVYDHLYEAYLGAGYLRFTPGATLQRVNEYDWNAGFTRYFSERLGVTLDGRGYYGTPFVGLNEETNSEITKPAISQYAGLIGPTYRFYTQPRYSVSGRAMGGFSYGNFSGDTNGFGGPAVGLYPDGYTFAASAAVIVEYNVSPGLGLRVAPEYYLTGFGSKLQNNLGYTLGLVYRFGKQ